MRIVAVVLVAMLFIGPHVPQGTSASQHGCASPTPPAVSGTPVPAPATPGIVLFNEILLSPASTWNCAESGTYSLSMDSWIELFNPQDQPLDLYAVHASIDSGPGSNSYYLPYGAAIPAHGYLVVFPRTYMPFLQTETATLRLVIAGTTIDQVTVPTLSYDQSFAHTPDGSNNWQISNTPTIDASNQPAQATPTATSTHSTHGKNNNGTGKGNSPGSTPHQPGQPVVNGTQPAWSNLAFPPSQSTPDVQTTATTSLSSPTQVSDGLDILHRIALTLLAVALALALLWCWRLFSGRRA